MGVLSALNVAKTTLAGALNHKAKFIIEGELIPLYVQFNPAQYSIKESVEYSQVSAKGDAQEVTQYVGNITSETSLSFYFDTDSVLATSLLKSHLATDVSALTSRFSSLLQVKGELHRPPLVTFCWGSISVSGFITSVSTEFTMFNKNGMPVRAKVDCVLLSNSSEDYARSSPPESPDRTKSRILSEDANLWQLAEAEYGDAGKWREIARANRILDPLSIPAGTVLKVPALTEE